MIVIYFSSEMTENKTNAFFLNFFDFNLIEILLNSEKQFNAKMSVIIYQYFSLPKFGEGIS